MLLYPTAMLAKTRHPRAASSTAASIRSVSRQSTASQPATRRAQLLGRQDPVLGIHHDLVGGLADQARARLGDRLGDEDTSWHAMFLRPKSRQKSVRGWLALVSRLYRPASRSLISS